MPSCAWTWTRSCVRVPGGCWLPPWRLRSTTTWPPPRASGMIRADGWWCATATLASARSPPWLGLSTGDFVPALEAFFGSAAGLSAAVITRLVTQWQADHHAFCRRDLTDRDYVYVWADGVHFRVRLEQARLCCLVIVGVRADGTKELVAVADGERESTESWAELLRDLRRRGMRAPVVAVGDGALGLWAALRDVFPATQHQRDWVHKVANVLGCLPTSVQAGARKALA